MYHKNVWINRISLICLSALAGIIGPILFILIAISLEALQPGYNPIQKTVSELVHGIYGWLQTAAFFLFGLLLIVFAFRLYYSTIKQINAKLGTSFLTLSGLGFFLLGSFPSTTGLEELVTQQLIHNAAAGIIGAAFIAGCMAYALCLRVDTKWNKYWLYTIFTAAVCMIFAFLWAFTPVDLNIKGINQFLLLIFGFLWVEFVSIRLLKACLAK